jgi:prepilin-type N-terminal cleavage/methylation domain-containing protein
MSIKSIQQENGFTLIEVMIALLILAGGLMGAAYMQTRSVDDGTTANRLTHRVKSAEDRIEDFYMQDIKYSSIDLDDPDSFYKYDLVNESPADGKPIQDNTSPYYDIEAKSLGGKPLKNLTTIQITLTPKGEKSAAAVQRRTIVLNFIRSSKYNE